MKNINKFVFAAAITLVSFGSFAQTVSARASTVDSAEAEIAAQAKKSGASYKIIAAHYNNGVYMIAKLTK
ncbi:DUF1471 domain-containing protein [Serratia aquatilis]|uniref:DUF1471 domain-containing protein n=1 Tax=Serratia aquatilis TaxID=1737515 RepID=A0ABV6EI67_9GAMM